MKVLPDTSIWVDYLRDAGGDAADRLQRLIGDRVVLTCGPVVAEILLGTAPRQQDEVWLALGSLPWAELGASAWRQTGVVAGELRQAGQSVPLTDVAIAVAAARADAAVWTQDRDFERIKEVLPGLTLFEAR